MKIRVLFAIGVLFAAAGTDVAYAQRRVVVRFPRLELSPSPGTRLSPPLQAAVATDARFIGTTRDGDPVFDIPPGRSIDNLLTSMRKAAAVVSIGEIDTAEVVPIDQLILLLDNIPSPDQNTIAGLPVVDRSATGRWVTVRSGDGFGARELTGITETSGLRFAEPNYRYWLLQGTTPNDPDLRHQWNMQMIGAPRVWLTHHASNVLVAVLDSGIDLRHQDIAANLWVNPVEKRDGLDNDNNGVVDDIHGADFSNRDGDPSDPHGHGTHVAGIIGAVGNNGRGIAGVNWSIKMMAIRLVEPSAPDTTPSAPGSGLAAAIDYAVVKGAKVLNNSWGGGPFSVAISEAIGRSEKAGALFVAAAGNSGDDNDATPVYPASYPHGNIIAVASVDRADRLAPNSNFGRTSVDLAAPGVRVHSTLPSNKYGEGGGTSMAAPHVAGAIALVWSHPQFSGRSAAEIRQLILDNTRRVPGLRNTTVTGGVLDLSFVPAVAITDAPEAPRERPTDDQRPPDDETAQRVRLEGRVRTDYAIGAETTGWVLEINTSTEKIPWTSVELSFATDQQRRVAEQAMEAGLPVTVIGDVRAITGVEIRRRLILSVKEIESIKKE